MSTDIELVSKALTDFDAVAAGLEQLNKNYAGMLFEVDTPKGMEMAKAARAVLRKPRYEIERIRKDAKAPLLAIGKKLDAEAARITAEIMKLEDPIDRQIKNEETRKDNERIAKVEAEQKRVDGIKARIEEIRGYPIKAAGRPSATALEILNTVSALVIDDSYAEFKAEAQNALDASIAAMKGIHAERVNHEAEQARIVAERAELERLRTEQAERERAEREKLAEEERRAKAARDAEAAQQAATLQAQREELERQAKQMREAQEAEAARLSAARAELERQQAEANRKAQEAERQRLATEAAERKRKEENELAAKKAKYPGEQAIVDVLAKHFEVTEAVVRGWMQVLRKAA